MAFCKYAGTLYDNYYTLIDNAFITQYLPDAPEKCVSVYVYGLYLAGSQSEFNDIDSFSSALNLSLEDITNCFMYWEELGLVIINSKQPMEVIYQPVKSELLYKKVKPAKYKEFNRHIQLVIEDRMINPAEYMEYYTFLEETLFEPMALVSVAKYCVELKGKDINGKYVLAVARNLYRQGVRTTEVVEERLNRLSTYSDDALVVFKALKLRRSSDYSDRQLVEKWLKEYAFTMDTVLFVANKIKFGGMEALDNKLTEYYKNKMMSVKEISSFVDRKTQLLSLAKEINRTIGVYYQNVDFIVEEYLVKWINMGFDPNTLIEVSKLAFISNIRTLSLLDGFIQNLYKQGLTELTAIKQHITMLSMIDESIKEVLDRLGYTRKVNSNDRINYKTWTENWNLNHEIIMFGASKSANALNPLSYLSKLLSIYKKHNITTISQAEQFDVTDNKYSQKTPVGTQDVTSEQLRALIDSFDD